MTESEADAPSHPRHPTRREVVAGAAMVPIAMSMSPPTPRRNRGAGNGGVIRRFR